MKVTREEVSTPLGLRWRYLADGVPLDEWRPTPDPNDSPCRCFVCGWYIASMRWPIPGLMLMGISQEEAWLDICEWCAKVLVGRTITHPNEPSF